MANGHTTCTTTEIDDRLVGALSVREPLTTNIGWAQAQVERQEASHQAELVRAEARAQARRRTPHVRAGCSCYLRGLSGTPFCSL